MSQRNVQKLEKPAVKRTLRRFWEVTKLVPGAALLAVFTSIAYIALLIFVNTWVMGLIVECRKETSRSWRSRPSSAR